MTSSSKWGILLAVANAKPGRGSCIPVLRPANFCGAEISTVLPINNGRTGGSPADPLADRPTRHTVAPYVACIAPRPALLPLPDPPTSETLQSVPNAPSSKGYSSGHLLERHDFPLFERKKDSLLRVALPRTGQSPCLIS
jgi:hypothetical protein